MRPTLKPAAFKLPEPIRPRRCPNCAHPDIQHDLEGCSCKSLDYGCDGAGFLYPDPPDWWHVAPGHNKTIRDLSAERAWPEFCDTLYRVLDIVDTA